MTFEKPTYNQISEINNYQLKKEKRKRREMFDKVGMRNETYKSVGGERGEASPA